MKELRDLSDQSVDARKPVSLDQQSVGRLSRQDALQQQAMAKAQDVRRIAETKRVSAALTRISDGDYGWCANCGEQISKKRLEIDPISELCIDCASTQRR